MLAVGIRHVPLFISLRQAHRPVFFQMFPRGSFACGTLRFLTGWLTGEDNRGSFMHLRRAELISAWRSGAAFLLPACLAVLGALASILQLISSGKVWTWIAIVFVGAVLLAIFLLARPLLRKTFRGSWLFQTVRQTGVIDIEDRSNRLSRLPPAQVFNMPGIRCVMITGILDQIFQNFREDVRQFILRGGEAYVLIIHPREVINSLQSSWVQSNEEWVRYWKTNINEAQIAVDAILEAQLDQMPGFHLRFMCQLPPYFGILASNSFSSQDFDSRSFVRVQPLTFSQYVGRGVVLTLEKLPSSEGSPFLYFADDLLRQWEIASEDESFLDDRRRAIRG